MLCKDCLIWQNRKKHLTYLNTDYYNKCAHFGGAALLRELAKLIPHFVKLWRNNEILRDNICPEGRCILEVL